MNTDNITAAQYVHYLSTIRYRPHPQCSFQEYQQAEQDLVKILAVIDHLEYCFHQLSCPNH